MICQYAFHNKERKMLNLKNEIVLLIKNWFFISLIYKYSQITQ